MKVVDGAITYPQGFLAAGMHAGLKKEKHDLALVVSEKMANAAATYTKNVVKAAPLHVTKSHLEDGQLRAVVINSGNANACAPEGEKNAALMCQFTAEGLGIDPKDVAVSSTGVIGVSMSPKMHLVQAGIGQLTKNLGDTPQHALDAAKSIMTTDLTKKECVATLTLGGKEVRIGAMAKGSGMIHPNMGTMLGFITTDAAISAQMLQKALKDVVNRSFNRISVDGDSSTNDFCLIMANGMAQNAEIITADADYEAFLEALLAVSIYLAREIAADGEGATHLITCRVAHAPDEQMAANLARSVISSSLVKSAMFGRDANWGRILCAMGYSGEHFDPDKVSISFVSTAGEVLVCQNGRGLDFDEALALSVLEPHEIIIAIDLAAGEQTATCWGCDLTYEYVKINGEYRT